MTEENIYTATIPLQCHVPRKVQVISFPSQKLSQDRNTDLNTDISAPSGPGFIVYTNYIYRAE